MEYETSLMFMIINNKIICRLIHCVWHIVTNYMVRWGEVRFISVGHKNDGFVTEDTIAILKLNVTFKVYCTEY
jgi:hypothetical protein